MIGLGTIINVAAIVAGGLTGHFTGKLFREEQQESLTKACGISVLFIAISGAMQGMLQIDGGRLVSGKSMLVVLCLAIGTVFGELLGIENGFERFGEWLKEKTGNSGDKQFVNAFVTASLTVCIGAMAIVGSIEDGLTGNHQILFAKAMLDGILSIIFAANMGAGVGLSAVPVGLYQGSITMLASWMQNLLTPEIIREVSAAGGVLIMAIGVVQAKLLPIRLANQIPALPVAVLLAKLFL